MRQIATERGWCPLCGPDAPHSTVACGRDFEYDTVRDEFMVEACDACGTRFLDPRPVDSELPRLYPPQYEPYRFDTMPRPVRLARDAVQGRKVELIKDLVSDHATIADLGCGAGSLLRLLRRKGPATWHLLGWDFPGEHLDQLAADGFDVISAPIELANSREHAADLVILNQVIEHFARPDLLLEVVARLLRPGGLLLIETPDVDGLDARLFRRRYWGGYHFPRHLVLFRSTSLRTMVERGGFDVVSTDRLASPAFWNQSIHHLLLEHRAVAWLAGFFTIRNPVTLGIATLADLAIRRVAPTSNQRLVARLRPVGDQASAPMAR